MNHRHRLPILLLEYTTLCQHQLQDCISSEVDCTISSTAHLLQHHGEAIRQIIPLVRPFHPSDPDWNPFGSILQLPNDPIKHQAMTETSTLPSSDIIPQLTAERPPSFLGVEPSKPTTQDSVLVIVDAQNEYDHGLLAISDVKSSRAVIGDVLKKYRDAKGDVVSFEDGG